MNENTATELLLGYDFDNEGAVEAIMQVLSLLSAKYPVLVEVDDDHGGAGSGDWTCCCVPVLPRWRVTRPIFT